MRTLGVLVAHQTADPGAFFHKQAAKHALGDICRLADKKHQINVDIISQSFGEHVTRDIAFTVKMNDLRKTIETLESCKEELGIQEIYHNENLSKVSIIGVGIANKPGVAADMFEALYENNINMHMISTSEIKISVLVDYNDSDLAVRAIHRKFFN